VERQKKILFEGIGSLDDIEAREALTLTQSPVRREAHFETDASYLHIIKKMQESLGDDFEFTIGTRLHFDDPIDPLVRWQYHAPMTLLHLRPTPRIVLPYALAGLFSVDIYATVPRSKYAYSIAQIHDPPYLKAELMVRVDVTSIDILPVSHLTPERLLTFGYSSYAQAARAVGETVHGTPQCVCDPYVTAWHLEELDFKKMHDAAERLYEGDHMKQPLKLVVASR